MKVYKNPHILVNCGAEIQFDKFTGLWGKYLQWIFYHAG